MPQPPRPPGRDLLGLGGIISSSPGLETGSLLLTAASFTCPAGWLLAFRGPSCSEGLGPPPPLTPQPGGPGTSGPDPPPQEEGSLGGGACDRLFTFSERESSIPGERYPHAAPNPILRRTLNLHIKALSLYMEKVP